MKVFSEFKIFFMLIVVLYLQACAPMQQLSVNEEMARKAQVDRLYLESRKLFHQGTSESYQSAEAALELAIELLGKEARIVDALGCIEWARGNKRRATKYFQEAIELDSQFSESYGNLAFVALENGDLYEAEALFKIALSLKPSNYKARNNFAVYLSELGRLGASKKQLLRSLYRAEVDTPPIENNLEMVDTLRPS